MSEYLEVGKAIDVLRRARRETLKHHSSSISAFVRKCEEHTILKTAGSRAPRIQHHACPLEQLLACMLNDLGTVQANLLGECQDVASIEPERLDDDPRIVDLRIGQPDPSAVVKFRRGLSQRSLAIEFKNWQRTNPRVAGRARSSGLVPQFLEANESRFRNTQAAMRGIRHGTKLLRCEELFGGIGISALLIFHFTKLLTITLQHLPHLNRKIHTSIPITKLASQYHAWLQQCQQNYDGNELDHNAD